MSRFKYRIDTPAESAGHSGYAAMGQPVPYERRAHALEHLREMCPGLTTEEAFGFIEKLAAALSRDDPYACFKTLTDGTSPVDLTGIYRLMAALLASPSDTTQ